MEAFCKCYGFLVRLQFCGFSWLRGQGLVPVLEVLAQNLQDKSVGGFWGKKFSWEKWMNPIEC